MQGARERARAGAAFVAAVACLQLAGGCGEEPTKCAGLATRCGSLPTAEACSLQAGCTPTTRCFGTPAECSSRTSETSCTSHGCDWLPAACLGEAWPCDQFDRVYGGTDCAEQLGCSWDASTRICSGTVVACDGLDETACTEQNGCGWYPHCEGTPPPCGDRTTATDCGTEDGCRWDDDVCTGTEVACEALDVELCAWQEGCHVVE